MTIKKFNTPTVSSKIGICGLPLRVDTYSVCSFGCTYCFANNREIMKSSDFKVANLNHLRKTLERILDKHEIDENSLSDKLISEGITWHCGGLCDPFMPCEEKYHITSQMIGICNKYGISILFSTKGNSVYGADIRPDLHSFQLSVSNISDNKQWEPNVPSMESRYRFYRELKSKGFKVGIRIQPFIPGVTDTDIIDLFHDADFFTIESVKIVPQDKEYRQKLTELLNIPISDFKFSGLYNLKSELKLKYYKPFIEKLELYNIPFSIADNDLRSISKSKCCCGDVLIKKSTDFNTTALLKKYGSDYSLQNVYDEIGCYGNCSCKSLFASNRQKDVITVSDFFKSNINSIKNPAGKPFQYIPENDSFYKGYIHTNPESILQ